MSRSRSPSGGKTPHRSTARRRGAVLHRARRIRTSRGHSPPTAAAEPDGTNAVQVLRTYPRAPTRVSVRPRRRAKHRPRRTRRHSDGHGASCTSRTSTCGRSTPPGGSRGVAPRAAAADRGRDPAVPRPGGADRRPASSFGRERVLDRLFAVGGDRVAVFDLENTAGTPIYVHSKLCVIDDVWMAVGSDNLNRRSWTHDSELSCAVIDAERDGREPIDPGARATVHESLARDSAGSGRAPRSCARGHR